MWYAWTAARAVNQRVSHGGTTPRPTLSLIRGGRVADAAGRALAIGQDPITIGRAVDSDFVVGDAEVSAVHCELSATAAGVRVRDLGSTNGTFIQGLRVVDAYITAACLIRVGVTDLYFEPNVNPMV